MPEVDALALRACLESHLDSEANATAQRIVDDLIREQARAEATGDELELVLSTTSGQTRRQRIRPHPDPGVGYLLEEAEWTGCAWRHAGSEDLTRVEVDGDVWHEAEAATGVYDGP